MAPSSVVLTGPDAAEQKIVGLVESGEMSEFGTIHLATHALVDDESPERSALVLSTVGLPDPLEAAMSGERIYDGLVTAREIVNEWELDADLVTLSACETGLGRKVGGEGYIGFSHALFQAGARSLLVSLWKVEDHATRELMAHFYEALWGREVSIAEALWEAKMRLRHQRSADGSARYALSDWAGWVLTGDPD